MRTPVHKNSPIFPAGKVTLPLTTGGGIHRDLNSFDLSNTNDTVMDVTEVRFFVVPNPVAAPVFTDPDNTNPLWEQFDFGSILKARLATSKVTLTPDFVHLRSFAAIRQWNLNASVDLSVAAIPYNSTFFAWKFDRPMSVRPGDGIRCSIGLDPSALWPVDPTSHNPAYNPPGPVFTGVDVWVAMVGKLRDEPLPDLLAYPMALEWNPVLQGRGGTTQDFPAFAATGNTQFRNVGRSDLLVERMVASLYARFTPTDPAVPLSTYSKPIDLLNGLPSAVDATIADGTGYAVVADRAPLQSIVDARSGNWRFNSRLKFDQQFSAQMFANQVDAALFPEGANNRIQPVLFPHLALLGSQLVSVPR